MTTQISLLPEGILGPTGYNCIFQRKKGFFQSPKKICQNGKKFTLISSERNDRVHAHITSRKSRRKHPMHLKRLKIMLTQGVLHLGFELVVVVFSACGRIPIYSLSVVLQTAKH